MPWRQFKRSPHRCETGCRLERGQAPWPLTNIVEWTHLLRLRTGYAVEQDLIESARHYLNAEKKNLQRLEPFVDDNGNVREQTDFSLKRFAKVLSLFLKTGEEDRGEATLVFGKSYLDGEFSPKDGAKAYAWFEVASQRGVAKAGELRDQVKSTLNEEQIEAAQQFIPQLMATVNLGSP